jgi:pimeloyl-ACP methyl ester carboxylesterase
VYCLPPPRASAAVDAPPAARLPCLVLGGSEDAYAPPAEVARFAGALPGPMRRIELNDCGHMPFFEYPALFSNWIAEFLKSQDAHP